MPNLFTFMGYVIFFWSGDKNEPIHVHIAKGHPRDGATKFWILTDGVSLAYDDGSIPKRDLKKIAKCLQQSREDIVNEWGTIFKQVKFKR